MNTEIILQLHPGWTLLAGLAVLAFSGWFFYPHKGGLALIKIARMSNERVHLEDALKFMFDCEYRDTAYDMNSIAGNLNIKSDKASDLIERLLEMELIHIHDQKISLTDTGRSYALRVIRVHRIWERYLADETSVAQSEWHNEACRIEHHVTVEDTEKLAAQMGNPVFDPHGDPIPTPDGELPAAKGEPLSHLGAGKLGRIIHIEDEPKSIYEQLIVLGLYPGMQVYVTDVTEHKITFAAEGDECTLTPLFASQITVEKLSGVQPKTSRPELLSELNIGDKAEIAGISANCRGQQRRRLMDLGIVPGSTVSVVMKSASGDPIGYRVMGTTIGIRKNQADLVFVKRKNKEANEYAG